MVAGFEVGATIGADPLHADKVATNTAISSSRIMASRPTAQLTPRIDG
jgi:hypothetical protein